MESNRDEAERCISIALNAIKSQKAEKALRFLEKAQRLFPTDKARGKDGERRSGSGRCGGRAAGSGTAVASHLGSRMRTRSLW